MRLVFDRGTVLIPDPPQDVDLADVRGLLWDPRVKAYRAPARRYVEVVKDLSRRGVPFWDGVPFLDPARSQDPRGLLTAPGDWSAVALPDCFHPDVEHAVVWRDPRQAGAVGRDGGADTLGVAEQNDAGYERHSHREDATATMRRAVL